MFGFGAAQTRRALFVLVAGCTSACTFPEYDLYRGAVGGAGGVTPLLGGASSGAGTAASAGGPGGSAASAGSSSSPLDQCEPASQDTRCDGFDAACDPTGSDDGCPSGCFGLQLYGSTYMSCLGSFTFEQAETKCRAQGMHLAKIDSDTENELALEIATQLGPYVWIGASNNDDVDEFTWRDGDVFYRNGAAMPGRYDNFAAGQPQFIETRRCVQLEEKDAGVWSTTLCSDTQQFICEAY